MPATLVHHYKKHFSDRRYALSLLSGFGLLAIALTVNYFAAIYAADHASNSVTDIFLSNFKPINVDDIFVYGPVAFWAVIAGAMILDPKKAPFGIKAVAVFVLVRSLFITLTHIGPFPDHIALDTASSHWMKGVNSTNNLFIFSSGSDLFFSAHTGLPFLMTLVFWRYRLMRIFCLLSAIFFGIVVLLGHLHYTIDVLSAFFITYSIYHIAEWAFARDYTLFHQKDPA